MDADREPNLRPQRREALRLRGFFVVAAFEDDQRALDAGVLRASHDLRQVARERLVREVAMAVDNHRTRVPGSGGFTNVTTSGLPPSGLAASTMPFDSIPISFAGFRLKTITTVLPT